MNSVKMAELVVMPFVMLTRVGLRNHVLDGGLEPPVLRGNFVGEVAAHRKAWSLFAASWAATMKLIEMLYGLWTRVGHILDGGPDHRV